jgi:general secretion pathway protein I
MTRRGFTLLEVLVALAILGMSLLAIIQINSQAITSHLYARKLTVATLLARSKLIDLEQKLYDEPLPADDEEESGDFSDEGWPSYKWRSKVIVPQTNGLSPEQLFAALFNLPVDPGNGGAGGLLAEVFGAGAKPTAGGAAPAGQDGQGLLAALGPMAGMASAQFTQIVDQLQKSVREVHLTVTWKEGTTTESIDLVTHVVSLGPGSDRNGGAAAAAGGAALQAQANPSGTFVRPDGTPAHAPRAGPNGQMVDDDGAVLLPGAQPGGIPMPPALLPGAPPPIFPGAGLPTRFVPGGVAPLAAPKVEGLLR